MADIQPTDEFIVNRNDTTGTVPHADLMASLDPTDLLIVNRSDKVYTITGKELEDSIKPSLIAPKITNVALAQQTPDTPERFTNQKFDFTVACKADGSTPMKFKAKAKVTGDLNKTLMTDEIIGVKAEPGYSIVSGGDDSGIATLPNAFNSNADDAFISSPGGSVKVRLNQEYTGDVSVKWKNNLQVLFYDSDDNYTGGATRNTSQVKTEEFQSSSTFQYLEFNGQSGTAIEIYQIYINDVPLIIDSIVELTFDGDKDLDLFTAGDEIRQEDDAATGTVGSKSVNNNTITLSVSTGTWGPVNDGHHVIGPTKVVENSTMWLKFNPNGDGTLERIYLLDEEPNWTSFAEEDKTSAAWTIVFPEKFSDRNKTPDEVLPPGTKLCVRTEVTNDGGTAPLSTEDPAEACNTPGTTFSYLSADNPQDVEQFEVIKAAMEAYPDDVRAAREALVAKILTTSLSQEDKDQLLASLAN